MLCDIRPAKLIIRAHRKKDICPNETMLRTNQSFLQFIHQQYQAQPRKEDIVVRHYHPGQKLLNQHEKATKVMCIKDGITKCFFTEENDKAYILEFLGNGEIIGELEYLQNIPCLCHIEALTPVTAYAISIPFFKTLLDKDISLNHLLLNIYAERIVNTASRASYQQLYTVEYSLSKLLDLLNTQEITLSKEDMAAYLGVSVRSLNRSLKNLST